jgi:hypothetical protein
LIHGGSAHVLLLLDPLLFLFLVLAQEMDGNLVLRDREIGNAGGRKNPFLDKANLQQVGTQKVIGMSMTVRAVGSVMIKMVSL